jgi:hypothetical protein
MSTVVAILRGLGISVLTGTMLVSCTAKAEQTQTMPRIGVLAAPYASVPPRKQGQDCRRHPQGEAASDLRVQGVTRRGAC